MAQKVKQKPISDLKVKPLALDLIKTDGGTQSRVSIDESVVTEYCDLVADADGKYPFDHPIDVFDDGNGFWLADGFHRYMALQRAGSLSAKCMVHRGTQRDAILFSFKANIGHGLRLSRADKRKAVQSMLKDEEWTAWSDRAIAKQCGCSHTLVQNLRNEIGSRTPVTRKPKRQVSAKPPESQVAILPPENIGKPQTAKPNCPDTQVAILPPDESPKSKKRVTGLDGKSYPVASNAEETQTSPSSEVGCAPGASVTLTHPAEAPTSNSEPQPDRIVCPVCEGGGHIVIDGRMPESLRTDEFIAAWSEWVVYRTQKRQKLTTVTIRRQFQALERMGPQAATEALNTSMEHGWTGVFDPREKRNVAGRDRASIAKRNQTYDPNKQDEGIQLTG